MNTPTDNTDSLREHYKREIEYVLETSDETGEVRISYADGHSEIKPAKVLLLDDIMHFVDAYVKADRDKAVRAAATKAAHCKHINIYSMDSLPPQLTCTDCGAELQSDTPAGGEE